MVVRMGGLRLRDPRFNILFETGGRVMASLCVRVYVAMSVPPQQSVVQLFLQGD